MVWESVRGRREVRDGTYTGMSTNKFVLYSNRRRRTSFRALHVLPHILAFENLPLLYIYV